ncbi:hypothetical protein LMBIIBHN_02792 [Aeromonas salmonicida]
MQTQPHAGPGTLFSLTWPLFIDLALHFLTGALNTFMVGHVSYQGVAALAVGNQVFDLAITLFSFVSIGTSVVITQYLGAGDRIGKKPASSSTPPSASTCWWGWWPRSACSPVPAPCSP